MDIRTIKKLIQLLESSNLMEIEIKEGNESVRISRGQSPQVQQAIHHVPLAPMAHHHPAALSGVEKHNDRPISHEPSGLKVESPMVGIFYTAPSPGTPNFVEVGKSVKKGDIICIIEAMKMFNQIETDKSGIVKAILVENGEPVEFGQPLIIIE